MLFLSSSNILIIIFGIKLDAESILITCSHFTVINSNKQFCLILLIATLPSNY